MPFYGISTVVSSSYVQVVGCTFRPVVDVQVTLCNALLWYKYYVQIAVVMYLSWYLGHLLVYKFLPRFRPSVALNLYQHTLIIGHLLPILFVNIY